MTTHRAKSERGIKELPYGNGDYAIRSRGKLERKVFAANSTRLRRKPCNFKYKRGLARER